MRSGDGMNQPNEVISMVKAADEVAYIPAPIKNNREQYERNRVARRKLEEMRDMQQVNDIFDWEKS